MIRVAVETATPVGTVAVGRAGVVLAEVALGVQTRHAEAILPALDAALALAGEDRSAIDEVVVGGGPGSFTGVRVAAATAKGLVAALDRPLIAYSSLLALAAGVPFDGPVCALFDARRGEVYAGCWRVDEDGLATVVPPMVGPVAAVLGAVGGGVAGAVAGAGPEAGALADELAGTLFVGDGALRYRDLLVAAGARAARVPAFPRASALLWLAEHHPSGARVADAAGWEPEYVRESSAERGVAG
jgi:tRNA threonylcarbamoyladenosine biosynthesis protein TsaB